MQEQPTYEELTQMVADLKQQLDSRPIQQSRATLQPSLGDQLEHLNEGDILNIYQVKDAPYILIGNALYKQLKLRSDKRYHITYFDGTDGFLLLSDITREALKYNIQPLQCHVTSSDSEL